MQTIANKTEIKRYTNTMKHRYFFLLLLVIFASPSCKKSLDIKPRQILLNDFAITTVRDLEAVAAGMYDGLQSSNVLGGNQIVFSELLAEETQVQQSILSNFGTREIYEQKTTVQIGMLRSMWAESYSVINRANNVIATIESGKLSGNDFEAVKNKLKGEAYFIRGIVHFQLCRLWATSYDPDAQGGNSQPGIVIRTEQTLSAENLSKARSTVEEVYAQVIADLQQAETLLGNAGIITSVDRASELAATAFLARVYFFKGDNINASSKAREVINSGNFSLNDSVVDIYKTSGNTATTECIFQLVNISTDQSSSLPTNFQRTKNPLMLADTSVINKYDATDRRLANLLYKNPFTGLYYTKKYDQSGAVAPNVTIIRFAEMHLILAESNLLSNGDPTEAIASYNEIIKRAMQTNFVAETTATGLLPKVLLQRQLELYCEGDRFDNLRRMKNNVRFGTAYNAAQLLFKIPQEEMAGNSLMEQNP